MSSAKYLADCDDYVGDFWDPTHQCPSFSGSVHCDRGYLCDDDEYEYHCDFDNDRYSCAPGDFSGKFGSADEPELVFQITSDFGAALVPNTADLVGRLFAVYCGNDDTGISYLMCTPFEGDGSGDTDDDDTTPPPHCSDDDSSSSSSDCDDTPSPATTPTLEPDDSGGNDYDDTTPAPHCSDDDSSSSDCDDTPSPETTPTLDTTPAPHCSDDDSSSSSSDCDDTPSPATTPIGATTEEGAMSEPWSYSAGNPYVATFGGDHGITGTVTVDNGFLAVELDLTAMPWSWFSDCASGGLQYHIHETWEHSSSSDQFNSTLCGASFTGGHFDPWHACGSASGSKYCGAGNSNSGIGCISDDDYSVDYDNDPFSAEVGDWNGKYGVATASDDGTISFVVSSYWEVRPEDVEGLSVVFHCNDGTRAFCAPFELDTATRSPATTPTLEPSDYDDDATLSPATTPIESVYEDVSLIPLIASTDIGTIQINDGVTGYLSINLDWSELNDTSGCTEFGEYLYGIFEAKSTMSSAKYLTDCDDSVGDFWDPTHQCPSFSGSEHCSGGRLCGDNDYDYDCDFNNDRYSCAPGDFSGKFGSVMGSDSEMFLQITSDFEAALVPNTADLVGKLFAVYCGNDVTGISYLMCTPFDVVTVTTTSESESVESFDGDSAGTLSAAAALSVVATVFAVLF